MGNTHTHTHARALPLSFRILSKNPARFFAIPCQNDNSLHNPLYWAPANRVRLLQDSLTIPHALSATIPIFFFCAESWWDSLREILWMTTRIDWSNRFLMSYRHTYAHTHTHTHLHTHARAILAKHGRAHSSQIFSKVNFRRNRPLWCVFFFFVYFFYFLFFFFIFLFLSRFGS